VHIKIDGDTLQTLGVIRINLLGVFFPGLLVASTSVKLEELSWPVQVGLQIKLKRSVEADVYSSLNFTKLSITNFFKV